MWKVTWPDVIKGSEPSVILHCFTVITLPKATQSNIAKFGRQNHDHVMGSSVATKMGASAKRKQVKCNPLNGLFTRETFRVLIWMGFGFLCCKMHNRIRKRGFHCLKPMRNNPWRGEVVIENLNIFHMENKLVNTRTQNLAKGKLDEHKSEWILNNANGS